MANMLIIRTAGYCGQSIFSCDSVHSSKRATFSRNGNCGDMNRPEMPYSNSELTQYEEDGRETGART